MAEKKTPHEHQTSKSSMNDVARQNDSFAFRADGDDNDDNDFDDDDGGVWWCVDESTRLPACWQKTVVERFWKNECVLMMLPI